MTIDEILPVVGFTEPSTFAELCDGLRGELPRQGDRAGWREFFDLLDEACSEGLLYVERREGKIQYLRLTRAGAEHVRGLQKVKAR